MISYPSRGPVRIPLGDFSVVGFPAHPGSRQPLVRSRPTYGKRRARGQHTRPSFFCAWRGVGKLPERIIPDTEKKRSIGFSISAIGSRAGQAWRTQADAACMRGGTHGQDQGKFPSGPAGRSRSLGVGVGVVAVVVLLGLARGEGVETPDRAEVGRTNGASSASCMSCHQMDQVLSHPIGVRPRGSVPLTLPLEEGKVGCMTCHDPGSHRQTKGGSSLREGMEGAALCRQCHGDGAASPAHARGGFRAHLGTKTARSGAGVGGLDSESQACMSCHDGSLASDAGSHRSFKSMGEANTEHPVGVAYVGGGKRLSEMRLIPASRLDPRIRLFDGKMGCGSCHSPYSRMPNKLLMSNAGSKLCLSCHEDR